MSSITVAVNALDADSNIIMGSYVDANGNPLTVNLADSNTTDTPLSTTSVANSSTAVTLSYDGTNISAPTITPSVTGGTFAGTASAATLKVDVPSAPGVTGLSQIEWVTSSSTTSFPETITGSNFTAVGTTVGISGPGLTVSNVTVESSTTITATVTLAANSGTSSPTITVTTPGGSAGAGLSIDPGFIVTSSGDTMPGSPAGTGPGVSGDLRYALSNAVSGDAIVFSCGSPCTIELAGPLPPIELSAGNLVIDGASQTFIDGGSTFSKSSAGAGAGSRVFFVDTGTVFFSNLTIQNALAQGGAGNYGGGGGLGAGAGIFVNQSSATANVFDVSFINVAAIGGAGSAIDNFDDVGGGGGGGLDAAGGANPKGAGSGGGGVLSQGGSTSYEDADAGGGGGGGLGGAEGGERTGGTYGTAYGSNAAGTSGSNAAGQADNSTNGGNGGNGGFGGGGGGGGSGQPGMNTNDGVGGNGGTGGFGGGGGAGATCGNAAAAGSGGNGGPGGGGGAAYPGTQCVGGGVAGNGGSLASLTGGNGAGGNGGGGAAAGPAIFVNAGSLNTSGVTVSSFTITAGQGVAANSSLGSSTSSPGTAGTAPVFNYAGRVNGSSTTGDITSAATVSSTLRRTVAHPRGR